MKYFKKNTLIWLVALLIGSSAMISCVDEFAVGDDFLEKQPGVDVTIDTIFSKSQYAEMFLWETYKYMNNGHSTYNCMNSVMVEALSDVVHSALGWGGVATTYYSGLHSEAGNGNWIRDKFAFVDGSGRKGIWDAVRRCWIFIENVDRVPDMDNTTKARLKAEAKLLMATRYYDALCNFGGLPLVDHVYQTGEDYKGGYMSSVNGEGDYIAGRATVEQTAIFIDNLLQQVIDEPAIPFSDSDYTSKGGRLTKGGAYGMRARLWWYVASPLFNNAQPYRQYDENPVFPVGLGENVDPLLRVWVGGYKPELWTKCVQACEAFFNANNAAGNPYELVQPQGTSEGDYRRAYRSAYFARETTEKIIEVRGENNGNSDGEYLREWGSNVPGNVSHSGAHAPTVEWFNMFSWANGKNFDGQRVYNTGNNENLDVFAGRDPRLYESMLVPQRRVDEKWNTYQNKTIDCWIGGDLITGNWWFTSGYNAHGFGEFKFVLDYHDYADERYVWGYLRIADLHLIYAEALAQVGANEVAIQELDKVRARVGLPSLNVNTQLNLSSKDVLINEILRERACELGMENSRVYDLIRYKRQDIFSSPLHRMSIYAKDAQTGVKTVIPFSKMNGVWPNFIYEVEQISSYPRAWWNGGWDNKWLLSPIGRSEINKDYGLSQNPGW